MPRPKPPRRKPRQRRRNPNVVKVPQQLRDQETDGNEAAPPPPRTARAAVRATAPAPAALDTSEWSRRSLYVLVALMAVTELLVSVLVYSFSKVSDPLGIALLVLSPYALLAAAFISMPIARRITREARYLRVVETAMVAVFVFFLWYFFLAGGSSILAATGNPAQSPTQSPHATALANGSSPGATPSSGPSSSATPSASTTAPLKPTATVLTALAVVDVLAFALTPLMFYPVYRRFRFKGRMPRQPAGRGPPNDRKR